MQISEAMIWPVFIMLIVGGALLAFYAWSCWDINRRTLEAEQVEVVHTVVYTTELDVTAVIGLTLICVAALSVLSLHQSAYVKKPAPTDKSKEREGDLFSAGDLTSDGHSDGKTKAAGQH